MRVPDPDRQRNSATITGGATLYCVIALALTSALLAPQYRIAYWLNDALWTMSAEGGFTRKIADGLPAERPLVASPDGRRLIYWDHGAGHWDLISVAPDGSDRRNLTTDLGGGCRSAVFSPDSSRIAFMCDGPNGLYVMNADGSGKRRLSALGHRDEPPAWSPDGTWIAWADLDEGGMMQYAIPSGGGDAVRIGRGRGSVWTPNGKAVLFSARGRIHKWVLATRASSVLLSGCSGPAFSVSGGYLAFQTSGGALRVVRWPSLEVAFTSRASSDSYVWSPDGEAIAYSSPEGIRTRTIATGVERRIPVKARFFAWVRANSPGSVSP